MKKLFLISIGLIFSCQFLFGQGFYNKNRNRNLVLSIGSGTTHYYGDLAKNGDHSNIRPNLAIGARYNAYRWISVGAEVTWFMLAGEDQKDPVKEKRNLSFQSHNRSKFLKENHIATLMPSELDLLTPNSIEIFDDPWVVYIHV